MKNSKQYFDANKNLWNQRTLVHKDSDFYDLGHLNSKGAIKFSVWFNALLEKDILYMDNKQELIDEQIKMLENE